MSPAARPRRAARVGAAVAAALAGAGLAGVLRGAAGSAPALLFGAGVAVAAIALACRPAPRGTGPRPVDLRAPGAAAPRRALVTRRDPWRSSAPGLGALGVVVGTAGVLRDGRAAGDTATVVAGATGVVVSGAVAGVLLARGLARRSVALTVEAVVVRAGRAVLEIPWRTLRAVRAHGPEDGDGRPRRVALEVTGPRPPGPASRLWDRLALDTAASPRVLVLPTAGLDTDPALLLAALDHYLELPGERADLPDHDWSSAPASWPPT